MQKIRRMVASIIVLTLVCTSIPMDVMAAENVSTERGEFVDKVYVDGVEYNVEFDPVEGNLIVSGETDISEGTLVLTSSGDATINIENKNQVDESYILEIEELSEDSVDIEVYDENGDLTEYYDEYEQLVEDGYEGQTAVSVSLVVGAAVLLCITTSYIIIKSGVVYCIADAFTKAVSKAKTAAKEKARSYYYPAFLKTVNGRTYVYINPQGINVNAAATLVKGGASIYSYTAAMARKVLTTAGYVPCSSKGVKNQAERHSSPGYQFYHYHAGRTNSKGTLTKTGSIHSLYGTEKFYN